MRPNRQRGQGPERVCQGQIEETIKKRNRDMQAMSNFDNLSISSSNDSIKSIISNTSNEELDGNSRKPAHKK
eukprot:10158502-Ditylum_brightwellii.AAC.1